MRLCSHGAGGLRGRPGMKRARAFPRIDTARLMRRGGGLLLLCILAIFFLAGSFAGAAAGSGGLGESAALPTDGGYSAHGSYFSALASCAVCHLLVLLSSTSLAGGILIPAALAFRGFTLSCSAAYIAASDPAQGAAFALITLGLPALFSVPSLFLLSASCMEFTLRLLSGFLRRPLPQRPRRGDNRLAASAAMLLAAAAAEYYLAPLLVRLLLN